MAVKGGAVEVDRQEEDQPGQVGRHTDQQTQDRPDRPRERVNLSLEVISYLRL